MEWLLRNEKRELKRYECGENSKWLICTEFKMPVVDQIADCGETNGKTMTLNWCKWKGWKGAITHLSVSLLLWFNFMVSLCSNYCQLLVESGGYTILPIHTRYPMPRSLILGLVGRLIFAVCQVTKMCRLAWEENVIIHSRISSILAVLLQH